jgi:multiple sugar transport system substrate-binding protein
VKELQNLVQELQSGRIARRRFISRAAALGLSLSSIEVLLQACGGSSGGTTSSKATINWSVWGNPGELQRLFQFTETFNKSHPAITAQLRPIATAEYEPKLLTQLNGGVAPDAFYSFDTTMIKLIQNKTIIELTPLLNGPKSQEKPEDFSDGLWGVSRTADGKIYGAVVDCNPLVLWYNKGVLQTAGVTEMPADLYEQGKWNRDTFTKMLEKVHAKGKYGYILDKWALPWWSWVTTSGGTVYEDGGRGKFVAHQNPQAVDALKWLVSGVRSKIITFASSLPQGQGSDLAFMTNQVAFVCGGRWLLPQFKKGENLQYDIVPLPTNTGKRIEPAGVAVAYMVINKRTKYPDAAFEFLTSFVSKDGQTFRLQEGGNALPSIQGIDQIVTAEKLPAHAQYFIDTRNIGYAPFPAEMSVPGLTTDIQDMFDSVWLQGADLQATLNKAATKANKSA